MAGEGKGTAIAVGAAGLSIAALLTALTRKVEAGTIDEDVQQALAALANQDVNIIDRLIALESLTGVDVMPEEVGVVTIPFAFNLAVNQAVILAEPVSFLTYTTGYVKEVIIHWPNGCNALVNVRVGYMNTQFLPSVDFLALNNATPTYPFRNPIVTAGNEIWVEMQNTDGAWPHNITVTVSVVEWKT